MCSTDEVQGQGSGPEGHSCEHLLIPPTHSCEWANDLKHSLTPQAFFRREEKADVLLNSNIQAFKIHINWDTANGEFPHRYKLTMALWDVGLTLHPSRCGPQSHPSSLGRRTRRTSESCIQSLLFSFGKYLVLSNFTLF